MKSPSREGFGFESFREPARGWRLLKATRFSELFFRNYFSVCRML